MKKLRNVDDLAASLTADLADRLTVAATTPLVQPTAAAAAPKPVAAPRERKAATTTQQMTLRAPQQLVARYVERAAERSKELGRTVSAQQIMLEVLEQGSPA